MNTKTASLIIGIVFIAVGILGFIPNPIVGMSQDAIFHADTLHNMVHIISGIAFLAIALAAPTRAALFMRLFGLVYLLLGVMGLLAIGNTGMTELLGFLHVNGPDNYLHIGLGILIFLASLLPQHRVHTYHDRINP